MRKVAAASNGRSKRSRSASGRWLAVVYILLPLVGLGIDFAVSPVIFETTPAAPLTVLSLLQRDHVSLGTFRAHEIETGLNRLGRDDYLAQYRDTKPNALTISVFASEEGKPRTAALAVALASKLKDLAPSQALKLQDFLEASTAFRPGDVRALQLSLSPAQRRKFPVDWIYVAVLEEGKGGTDQDYYKDIFRNMMKLADQENIATLVIPAIGHNWQDDNAPPFDTIFRSALDALKSGIAPERIYFDLYDQWPTFIIERAVTSLNNAAEELVHPVAGEKDLNHRDLRLLLLLLTLCLGASAFVARLTFRAFLIISCAYTGLFLGSAGAIGLFTANLDPGKRLIVQVAVYTVLAVAFPFIARWKLDLVFGPQEPS